jgi:hypothetical protein
MKRTSSSTPPFDTPHYIFKIETLDELLLIGLEKEQENNYVQQSTIEVEKTRDTYISSSEKDDVITRKATNKLMKWIDEAPRFTDPDKKCLKFLQYNYPNK